MKKILILMVLTLLPVVGFAQNNHFFSYKSGSFDLDMNVTGQKMATHCVFDDFGALQSSEMPMMGQTIRTVIRDGKTYLVEPQFQEMTDQPDPINYSDLSPENIEKYHIQMVGLETVDGYECVIYTLMMEVQGMTAKGKVWVWEGFPIRTETTVMGMKVVTLMKNLLLDVPVDSSLFELPAK